MAFENDANLSDEQIVSEFNDLFGVGSDSEETETAEETTTEDGTSTDDDDTSTEDDDTSTDESEDIEEKVEDETSDTKQEESRQQKQQNYAFAEMRNKLKAQETLLANLGKAIGMDDKSKPEDVANEVQKILLAKQSKETGVPLDVLQRLQVLEQRDAEYSQHERQTKTQNALADLIEKYKMSKEDSDTFVNQLIDSGRNPMEVDGVDLESEYIKHNFQSLMKKAIDDAVNQERERNKKATSKSSTQSASSPDDGGGENKVNSVKELDKLFNSMEL